MDPALDTIIPDNPNQSYDMKNIIASIVDNGEFFEPHQYFAKNIIVCFARLNGRSIGIIANQPKIWQAAWILMHRIKPHDLSGSAMLLISRC